MAEETKFSEEELKNLKELQEGYLETQAKFGQLVIARLNLKKQSEELGKIEDETKSKFLELQEKEKDLVDGLTKKYGEGSLDPTTGVFTSSGK
tara:strand:- start:2304 stop:2582 length:279 start_codon:yes stop_codon:yes gene_type:complete